ncbi:Heavy metal transport/detoxification protein domain protein [Candidatus Magnetoovum chiemensis]|nr:Heavy metal transport/detoxification protein domain protein [Candidatus Magnetoovum chiemensis]
MSCHHCVNRVKKAVDAVDGVKSSDVVIGSASADIDDAKTDKTKIAAAIEEAGYKTKK